MTRTEGGGAVFGAAAIALSIAVVFLARDIDWSPPAENHDPGPRAFPLLLAACLLLGGGRELGAGLLAARRRARAADGPHGAAGARVSWRSSARDRALWRFAAVLGSVALHVALLPWLGFACATLLLGWGLLVAFGARWWVAPIASMLLVVVVHVLFAVIFKVQLPEGVLGLGL